MKRLLIGDNQEKLLSTLEVVLKHWGYRVFVTSRPLQVAAFIQESSPGLLILGGRFLAEGGAELREAVGRHVKSGQAPLIVLGKDSVIDFPHELLNLPLDVFSLFALIQRYLEKFPRQHLRLDLQLPAMLCRQESSHFSEIMSLSTRGLFLRTGSRLEKGDRLMVLFPLMGMKKELEVEGKVLYRVHPDPENNYLQGLGIQFDQLNEADRKALEAFLESRFFSDLSTHERVLPELQGDHLHSRSEITLRVI